MLFKVQEIFCAKIIFFSLGAISYPASRGSFYHLFIFLHVREGKKTACVLARYVLGFLFSSFIFLSQNIKENIFEAQTFFRVKVNLPKKQVLTLYDFRDVVCRTKNDFCILLCRNCRSCRNVENFDTKLSSIPEQLETSVQEN